MTPEKAAYMKQWRENNRDKIRRANRRWYHKNKTKMAGSFKSYYQQHRDEILTRRKQHHIDNRDKENESLRCYYYRRLVKEHGLSGLTDEQQEKCWQSLNKYVFAKHGHLEKSDQYPNVIL